MLNWYKNIKIASKLFLGFCIVTILTVVVGVVGIVNLRSIDKADTELYEENTVGISHLGVASSSFQRLRYNYLMLMNVESDEQIEMNLGNIEKFSVSVEEELNAYLAVVSNETSLAKAEDIKVNYQEFLKYMDEAIKLYEAGRIEDAKQIIIVDSLSIATDIFNLIDTLVDEDILLADKKATDNSNISNSAVVYNIIIIGVSIAISACLGLYISKIIGTPLKRMGEVANQLAVGDTDVVIDVKSKDETGQLADSFNAMIDNIKYQVWVVNKMAEGDLTIDVQPKSDRDVLGKNLKLMVEQNRSLINSTEMIASSIKKSEDGTKIARETSQALDEIVLSVNQASDLVTEIAAASNDQAMSIAQINIGIEQVLGVVQSNSATSEENAAASEELAGQSEILKSTISKFKV